MSQLLSMECKILCDGMMPLVLLQVVFYTADNKVLQSKKMSDLSIYLMSL